MDGRSLKEVDHVTQLKKENQDHWGSAFTNAKWFYEFHGKNPLCSPPHLLILKPPLEYPKTIQHSFNLTKIPSIKDLALDKDDGEEQKERPMKVCLLDESSQDAIIVWILHIWKSL